MTDETKPAIQQALAARVVELEAALRGCIAMFDSEIHNEYDGTSMMASRLAEADHIRAVLERKG